MAGSGKSHAPDRQDRDKPPREAALEQSHVEISFAPDGITPPLQSRGESSKRTTPQLKLQIILINGERLGVPQRPQNAPHRRGLREERSDVAIQNTPPYRLEDNGLARPLCAGSQ
jgi:hypothetical protein